MPPDTPSHSHDDDRTAAATDAEAMHAAATVEEVIRHRLSAALGGPRGSLETALPMLVFVGVWMWLDDAKVALGASAALIAAFAVARVVQRQSIQFVFSALIATGLAAFFALRSGEAEDAFLPGIMWNVGEAVVGLLSVALRWPLVGFMVGAGDPAAREDPFAWRRDEGMVRVCQRLTLVLVALFAVRVVIMLPLYLAENIALLSVAKIVLGWPAFATALAVMGWMLLRGHTPRMSSGSEPAHEESAHEESAVKE